MSFTVTVLSNDSIDAPLFPVFEDDGTTIKKDINGNDIYLDNNAIAKYNINWGFMTEECEYELTFQFYAEGLDKHTPALLLSLPNIGVRECYSAGNQSSTMSSDIVGIIKPMYMGVDIVSSSSSYADNCPIRLRGRPSSNELIVRLAVLDGVTIEKYLSFYALMLHFKKI